MGCGETLFVGGGGYITCSLIGCPKPGAVSQLLGDWETEHIVVVGEEGFSIQHPLRERLDGELFDCGLHEHMRSLPGPPAQPGRYRARRADETWSFGVLAS
jgi:hypothetical protein